MKVLLKPCLLGLLAVALGTLPMQAQTTTNNPATDKKSSAANKPSAEKKEKYIPFHGDLGSMDKSARTITVGKRTFQINSETKLYLGNSKSKSPATFEDATAGEGVSGTYKKTNDGKLVAHSVYFKPKTTATKSSDKKTK